MKKNQKLAVYGAGGALLLYLLYRWYQSKQTAAAANPVNQSGAATPADLASQAGQEQADVAALQNELAGLQGSTSGAPSQSDLAGLQSAIAGLQGQVTQIMAGQQPPPPSGTSGGGITGGGGATKGAGAAPSTNWNSGLGGAFIDNASAAIALANMNRSDAVAWLVNQPGFLTGTVDYWTGFNMNQWYPQWLAGTLGNAPAQPPPQMAQPTPAVSSLRMGISVPGAITAIPRTVSPPTQHQAGTSGHTSGHTGSSVAAVHHSPRVYTG